MSTTVTFKPAANGNDGMWLSSALFYNAITQAAFGNAAGVQYHMFIQFPNITIARAPIVTAAKITFNAHSDQSGTACNINISCINAANASAPEDLATCETLSLTAATAWNNVVSFTTDSNYDTVDIKTPIQTILNLSAWSSGNSIVTVLKNNASSTNAIRWVHTHEQGTNVCPVLTITYYDQWSNKINTVSIPGKVYGLSNASGSVAVNKINTVAR